MYSAAATILHHGNWSVILFAASHPLSCAKCNHPTCGVYNSTLCQAPCPLTLLKPFAKLCQPLANRFAVLICRMQCLQEWKPAPLLRCALRATRPHCKVSTPADFSPLVKVQAMPVAFSPPVWTASGWRKL